MSDNRIDPRIVCNSHVLVKDPESGRPMGHLVNISRSGFMMVTEEALPENYLFQLTLCLGEKSDVSLGAESLWCQDSSEDGQFWMGFQIIDISDNDLELIERMISRWRKA